MWDSTVVVDSTICIASAVYTQTVADGERGLAGRGVNYIAHILDVQAVD